MRLVFFQRSETRKAANHRKPRKKKKKGFGLRSWCRRRQEDVESPRYRVFSEDGGRAPANSDDDDDEIQAAAPASKCGLHSSQYSSSSFSSCAFERSNSCSTSFPTSSSSSGSGAPVSSPCSYGFSVMREGADPGLMMRLEAATKAWEFCSLKNVAGKGRSRSKDVAGVPVPVLSSNPYDDFKGSMARMIINQIDLDRLLQLYLSLNSPASHSFIFEAFSDICLSLYS